MNEPRDDGDLEPLGIDWALGERLGGERAPDLRMAVRAKLAGGSVQSRPARSSRLLQAALMLLGLGAVLGVAFWPKQVPGPLPSAAPAAQEPQPVQVSSLADVVALPASTRAVEAIGVGDDVIEALTRLHELEVLIVREPWNESFGLGLKTMAPKDPAHVGNGAWRQFAKCTKLRRLELRGTVQVARLRSGYGAAVVAAIENLPLLEALSLRCLDTADEVLQRLPKLRGLRELDLSFNHGFTEAGIAALRQCTGLRKLSLQGCQQLHAPWLATLGELPELEILELGSIDGINWRSGMAEPDDAEGQQLRQQARGWADSLQAGVQDGALAGLAKAPRLRVLDISGGRWTAAGLAELGQCTTLRELNMSGGQEHGAGFVAGLPKELERLEVCGDFTDGFCAAVREHLTKLRHLCVAACYEITDRGLAELCAMPSLRVLDMRQMRGLTVASAAAIGKATQLEVLDVRHNDWVTARHVLQWRRQLPRLRKVESNFSAEELAAAAVLPSAANVSGREGIEALPVDTRNVEGVNLDDACLEALLRLVDLECLTLRVADGRDARYWSQTGLRRLAKLPDLRSLTIDGRIAREQEMGFEALHDLPALETLTLQRVVVGDGAFRALAGKASLRVLHVQGCRGFTGSGLAWLAQAPLLRVLSLRGCTTIQAEWLVPLVGIPSLEELDLSDIDKARLAVAVPMRLPEAGPGVTDNVLEAMVRAANLHTLQLGKASITGNGLRHLRGLAKLRVLRLDETAIEAEHLQWLPAGIEQLSLRECTNLRGAFGTVLASASPRLETLDLSGCQELDTSIGSLAALGSLRKLSLTSCNRGFSRQGLQQLRTLPALRELDLAYCTEFSADAVDDLVALTGLEQLSLAGWRSFDTAEWNRLRTMPKLRSLQGDKFWEKLR